MTEAVTVSQCEEHRCNLKTEFREEIKNEKRDRENNQEKLENGIVRVEKRMDAMNSKLFAVILELLVGLFLGVLAYIGGKI